MNYIEVLIISAVLSALAYVAGMRVGFKLGMRVASIIFKVETAQLIKHATTMTEPGNAPAQADKRV